MPVITAITATSARTKKCILILSNMKCLILAFIAVVALASADDKYTTKYDNVDLKQILNNKRLLKGYVFCLLEKGPCSPDGSELKRVLPDAIATDCAKCSEKQKNGSKTVLRHLIDNEPEYWKELEAKYDAKGEYKSRYEAELKSEKKDKE